ncbi:hypothetical protein SDC9_25792 [bioreactor metagenome]|uniref:Uncharacterized protein n=1 Tax=bioreactor metagenome TaxID=1076179 RepID=A0A644ULV9_9ZZZZ
MVQETRAGNLEQQGQHQEYLKNPSEEVERELLLWTRERCHKISQMSMENRMAQQGLFFYKPTGIPSFPVVREAN